MLFPYDKLKTGVGFMKGVLRAYYLITDNSITLLKLLFTPIYHNINSQLTTSIDFTFFPRRLGMR